MWVKPDEKLQHQIFFELHILRISDLPAWKVEDHGFSPGSDNQVSEKQDISSSLIRKD